MDTYTSPKPAPSKPEGFMSALKRFTKQLFSSKVVLLIVGVLLLLAVINLIIDLVTGVLIFLLTVAALIAIPVVLAIVATWFKTRRH